MQFYAAFAIVIFGLAMVTAAFCVPPKGVIDPTVLTAFGEILTFAGTILGLDYHYRTKASDRHTDGKE